MTGSPSDDELMERIAAGDEVAARLLMQRWELPVRAFLTRMLGNSEEARDVSQDAFLKLLRSAQKYRASGTFRSWLFRIAGNQARSRLRRRRVIRWLRFDPSLHDAATGGEDAQVTLERSELHRAMAIALDRLAPRQREAIVLRYDHEFSYREVAAALDISPKAAESLLLRAIDKLRQVLEEDA